MFARSSWAALHVRGEEEEKEEQHHLQQRERANEMQRVMRVNDRFIRLQLSS